LGGGLRIKTTRAPRELSETRDLAADVKRTTGEWLGHVIKNDQTKMAKEFFKISQKGRRNVEGHRLRWLKDVENDLRELKMIT
jgi:hypothetical protein